LQESKMNAFLKDIRWSRVFTGGLVVPVLAQMALTAVTTLAPRMVEGRGGMLVALWTVLWGCLCALVVGLGVPARDAVRHGLLVGLVAALFDLVFYGWFGAGALLLFAATVLLGGLGGALARRERVAEG
jgi:hypothetical protein